MFSYDNPDDCAAIAQMNSELQHAQLELLSAHCASHQLRLHYSADDLAKMKTLLGPVADDATKDQPAVHDMLQMVRAAAAKH